MSQYLLDCPKDSSGNVTCTIVPYNPPPATEYVYALAPTWMYIVAAFLVLAMLIAFTFLVYYRIENPGTSRADRRLELQKAELDAKARVAEAQHSCHMCGAKYAPTLEDIKT